MPTSSSRLAPIDLVLVAAYLVAITVFGLSFRKRNKEGGSLKSYFLADNTIPWWAIALSIVSAETSTLTIVSIPGVAFAGNLGFLQVVLGYMLGRIVVAALFLPRYFRGEMLTAYQLIDRRFGATLHKLTAGLFLLTRAAAEGVRVFAISIVVSIAIGTGDTLSIAIISALTLLYTFEGGLAAVIWTDVVQMALYVAGTLVALFTLGAHVPGGWPHIHAIAAPLGKFHWLDFSLTLTKSYTFWAGILGGTFLTMASHGTDQLMVQRMLAARNLRESRLALLSSGVVIFAQFTLFLLIGVGLFVFYSTHPAIFKSNDYIFPTFIVHEMPHGVAGLLVAAILAAAMSNLSAALNSLASTTVIDFYVPFRQRRDLHVLFIAPSATSRSTSPVATSNNNALVSRLSTVFWALVLFAIAIYCVHTGGKGHVVETGLSIASVAYGCLLGVFLLGTLTRYATQAGAVIGMIAGLATNLTIWLLPSNPQWGLTYTTPASTHYIPWLHIAFTWYVLIGSLVTFAVGSFFSLTLPSKRARVAVATLLMLMLNSPIIARAQIADGGPQPATSTYDFTPVSALINQAIADHKLPGAVVVVGHKGQIVFEHAYGNRALEPSVEPMTEDTIFDMASLTKVLVTTTAVLQLYEQGKLDLDAPVAQYLPDFAQNGKAKITVRQLLTHYSGLPEDVGLKDAWGLAAPDKAEGMRRAMAAVSYGPTGVTFRYSDINFITLGLLVEQLSGETLDTYARVYIFEPLSMTHTAYHPFNRTCGPASFDGSAVYPGPKPIGRIGIVCLPGTWNPYGLTPLTAPTAHDDQGTAATNPDFDRLLRGTVHDPSTRRMGGVAGHAGVFSSAEDTAKFAQALLDRLLSNAGPFPLKQATLRLATRPQQPATAKRDATVFSQDGSTAKGAATRGLGWDINSAFSRPRGTIFPTVEPGSSYSAHKPSSFGHTGFTGTSLWLDPASNTYVILLANAVHPHVGANISALRGQVATAAAKSLGLPQSSGGMDPPPDTLTTELQPGLRSAAFVNAMPATLTGIDVLEATHFAALKQLAAQHGHHLRIGLLTNQSGLDREGRRTIDLLAHADPSITLTSIFTPEHGLLGKQDTERLSAEQDATTHLPVISLYGAKSSDRHPKQSDLKQLDAIVVDLQDAGVRFWTYEALLGYFLEACAKARIELVVLDRPNPIGGGEPQGPVSAHGLESYNNFTPMPVRHGLTLGELARFFNAQATEVDLKPELLDARAISLGTPLPEDTPPATQPGLHAKLTVVPMQNWTRSEYFADTQLSWTPPSPNLKTLAATILYPGVGLVEQTNVSVGRGTAAPFESLGAPYVNAVELAAYLTARMIPGITVTPWTLTIAETAEHYPSHGETIPAIHFEITDRDVFDSPEFGIELLAALHHLYPSQFPLDKASYLLASPETLAALKRNTDPREIAGTWSAGLRAFRVDSTKYLLYK